MFILNLTKQELTYRAYDDAVVLKPGVNLFNHKYITAKDLKNHFGDYISLITDEVKEPKVEEVIEDPVLEIAPIEEVTEEVQKEVVEEIKEAEAEVVEDKKPAKQTKKQNKKQTKNK